MTILLVFIAPRSQRSQPAEQMFHEYLERCSRYITCDSRRFDSEQALLAWLDVQAGRTPVQFILLDSSGRQLSSEELANHIGQLRDRGTQRLVLAVGPADGWSDAAMQRANLTWAFGRITLPHQLALVVLAEQTYRALTILAGHPYHSGH